MQIHRKIQTKLKEYSNQFRVVTILGPRQAGKTTLCKMTFPKHRYVSLENPEQRVLATSDPKTFLARFPSPVIIDEIQKVPELLSWIQGIVDENPHAKGQFVLTGSHRPLLKQSITQSLAGRTVLLTLLPLSFAELEGEGLCESSDPSDWILRGFLPEIYSAKLDPTPAYRAYTQTYVERDVRQLIQIRDQTAFERFLKLIAGRVGQLLNQNSLASDVGVSPNTINEWISVLEASFIIFRAIPYFKNFGKRLVKAPKLYFNDVGLAAYLLGLSSADQVARDPLYGQLFENLVMADALKNMLNLGEDRPIYFYRDSHGKEIDLLLQMGSKHQPIEIKSSATFNPSLTKTLSWYMKVMKDETENPTLVFAGETGALPSGIHGLNFKELAKLFV